MTSSPAPRRTVPVFALSHCACAPNRGAVSILEARSGCERLLGVGLRTAHSPKEARI